MAVSMSSGMISTRSGYLATKLIAIADAFRSQSAWSCRKAGKFDRTVFTHSGRVEAESSRESFIASLARRQFSSRAGKGKSNADEDRRGVEDAMRMKLSVKRLPVAASRQCAAGSCSHE